MEKFVGLVVMVASLSVAGLIIMKNLRLKSFSGRRSWAVSMLLLVSACLVLCDMIAGGGFALRLVLDLMLSLLALSSVMSSLLSERAALFPAVLVCLAEICLAVYYVLCACRVLELPPDNVVVCCTAMAAVCMALVFLYGALSRLMSVRDIMASGNAWSGMCLMVDMTYLTVFLIETVLLLCLSGFHEGETHAMPCIAALLLGAGQAAYGMRMYFGTEFLLFRKQELRVASAVKASKMELAVMRHSPDDSYREVYSRVLAYFEEEKPYLNGELTINDVVKAVYTNKLYISRAISRCSGKNFCQFVNWHRIMYSLENYRMNPDMRVADLWQTCGFNSVVSYNMSFKLFMGENPGEWCRREKARLIRQKK